MTVQLSVYLKKLDGPTTVITIIMAKLIYFSLQAKKITLAVNTDEH